MASKRPDLPEAIPIYICLGVIIISAPTFILKEPWFDNKLHGYPILADTPATDAFVMVGGFY